MDKYSLFTEEPYSEHESRRRDRPTEPRMGQGFTLLTDGMVATGSQT